MSNPEYQYSELPAIKLFQKLGYTYYNASENYDDRETISEVILKDRLTQAVKRLNPWINQKNLKKIVHTVCSLQEDTLMKTNQRFHHLIKSRNLSVKQVIDGREQNIGVKLLQYDPKKIDDNDYLVVNQMKFKGSERNSIPDLVVFINGMPLAVIECKSRKLKNAVNNAINDLIYYQENSEKLFCYNMLCVGICGVGGRYGAIGAQEIHYNGYKSDELKELKALLADEAINEPTNQDILIYNLFKKENLLDIVRNFIIYEQTEGGLLKKLPRYQQIRATNNALEKLKKSGQGGVVWHTQGSGKSITMIYIATKLRREENGFDNPTIIVMTDRKDLDAQITNTFIHCGFENPIQAASISDLNMLLKNSYGKTIMTTIQKFQDINPNSYQKSTHNKVDDHGNITKIKRRVTDDGRVETTITLKDKDEKTIGSKKEYADIEELSQKKNIYVLVDEAHRTQYGFLAGFMRKALPHAQFIAFTGTPIDKKSKSTLNEFYGGRYLDKYTIKQSIEDGATLPILYDAGVPELFVEKKLVENHFKRYFDNQTEEKKEAFRKEASQLTVFMCAKERIKRIAEHLIDHYRHYIYPNGHKAMLVCHNREAAIRYKEAFDEMAQDGEHPFQTRVVMSFSHKKDPKRYRQIATKEDEVKEAIENFKLPFGNESNLSRGGKKQFNNDAIMIVSDMLLTGYDIPVVQIMYLDKVLKEHTLLQAIARVNRTRRGKDAGFVMDYCGITENLVQALEIFSDDLKPEDVMVNIDEEIVRLRNRANQLTAFFNPVKKDRKREREEYIQKALLFLEPDHQRDEFKMLLKKFNQSINIVLPNPNALGYQDDFKLFNEIRLSAANMYCDESMRVSKSEHQKLQKIIDEHLRASGIENLLEEPISITDTKRFEEEVLNLDGKSKELIIANRIRHRIKVEMDQNPDFYKPLAERLEELIKMRKEGRLSQLDLLKEFEQIQKDITDQDKERQELGFTDQSFAVYTTLKELIPDSPKIKTEMIFEDLKNELSITEWESKANVQRTMRVKIKKIIAGDIPPVKLPAVAANLLTIIKNNI